MPSGIFFIFMPKPCKRPSLPGFWANGIFLCQMAYFLARARAHALVVVFVIIGIWMLTFSFSYRNRNQPSSLKAILLTCSTRNRSRPDNRQQLPSSTRPAYRAGWRLGVQRSGSSARGALEIYILGAVVAGGPVAYIIYNILYRAGFFSAWIRY